MIALLRRRREFRIGLASRGVSMLGSTLTEIAVPFQVYALTHSAFAIGAVGAVQTVPLIAVALYAGALADAVDRRRMVIAAELGGAAVAVGLVTNTFLHSVALIYALAALGSVCYSLLRPPMDAIIPRTVEPDELTQAVGAEGVQFNLIAVAGPAVGGLLLAATSLRVLYIADAASFVVSAALLTRLPPYPSERELTAVADIREGIAFARSRPELVGTYVTDLTAMIFGIPNALFAALAPGLGGPRALGALYAAPAAGALLVSLGSGPARHVRRHGRAIVLAAAGWGVAIAGFGLVHSLPVGLVLLAVAGGCDAVSGIFRFTLWNQTVPDALRGRLAGIEMVSWGAGPGLGDLESGALAGLIGVRRAIVAGGVACAAGCAAIGAALPALWNYVPPDSPPDAAAASAAGTPS